MTKDAAAAAFGKAVLATRGGCAFLDKAESVDTAGPSGRVGALIVTNDETTLFHMGASPRYVEERHEVQWDTSLLPCVNEIMHREEASRTIFHEMKTISQCQMMIC